MNIKVFERAELKFLDKIKKAYITDKDGNVKTIEPFVYQDADITYNIEGIESALPVGEPFSAIRFTLKNEGDYSLKIDFENGTQYTEDINCRGVYDRGYIGVSKRDKRFFEFSDGTSFYPIGMNMAFPRACGVSDGTEFGLSKKVNYMGLRQYERWFKKASDAGVNTVRLWLGHDYFSPDTKCADKFDYVQFTKIDKILELAKKHNIKLKITLEQYRSFAEGDGSNVSRYFNKSYELNGEKCKSMRDWLTQDKWKCAYLNKINEFAKRYSGDTGIFMIELWNEMNCVGDEKGWATDEMRVWNREMLPKVKEMFKDHLVTNSLGSLDCEDVLALYDGFPWEVCDVKQMHRYLDQGGGYVHTTRNPIEVIKEGTALVKEDNKPFLVAETGAVNNCHSGEFKYYSCDDRGTILVDSAYTGVFMGCAGCSHIWHWDERYVESKNLYKYYKPLADMVDGIDFAGEKFKTLDYSDDEVYFFILEGKTQSLGFVRNKSDNWQNVLRDLGEVATVSHKAINTEGKKVTEYPIWDDDTTTLMLADGALNLKNIKYGTIFKICK